MQYISFMKHRTHAWAIYFDWPGKRRQPYLTPEWCGVHMRGKIAGPGRLGLRYPANTHRAERSRPPVTLWRQRDVLFARENQSCVCIWKRIDRCSLPYKPPPHSYTDVSVSVRQLSDLKQKKNFGGVLHKCNLATVP